MDHATECCHCGRVYDQDWLFPRCPDCYHDICEYCSVVYPEEGAGAHARPEEEE